MLTAVFLNPHIIIIPAITSTNRYASSGMNINKVAIILFLLDLRFTGTPMTNSDSLIFNNETKVSFPDTKWGYKKNDYRFISNEEINTTGEQSIVIACN